MLSSHMKSHEIHIHWINTDIKEFLTHTYTLHAQTIFKGLSVGVAYKFLEIITT